jgi:hypothetical protein
MRLLDCVIFSAPVITRRVGDDIQPAPCHTPPATGEARPDMTAGGAWIMPRRYPPWPRIQSAEVVKRSSNLTPGITRRPAPLNVDESRRVGGRVQAVVMRGVGSL